MKRTSRPCSVVIMWLRVFFSKSMVRTVRRPIFFTLLCRAWLMSKVYVWRPLSSFSSDTKFLSALFNGKLTLKEIREDDSISLKEFFIWLHATPTFSFIGMLSPSSFLSAVGFSQQIPGRINPSTLRKLTWMDLTLFTRMYVLPT